MTLSVRGRAGRMCGLFLRAGSLKEPGGGRERLASPGPRGAVGAAIKLSASYCSPSRPLAGHLGHSVRRRAVRVCGRGRGEGHRRTEPSRRTWFGCCRRRFSWRRRSPPLRSSPLHRSSNSARLAEPGSFAQALLLPRGAPDHCRRYRNRLLPPATQKRGLQSLIEESWGCHRPSRPPRPTLRQSEGDGRGVLVSRTEPAQSSHSLAFRGLVWLARAPADTLAPPALAAALEEGGKPSKRCSVTGRIVSPAPILYAREAIS